jgi:hypothetical protein
MRFSILIPHFRSKITAYTVAKLIEYKGDHDIEILVCDNSRDESIKYLEPFKDQITIVQYPSEKIQSHGVALDMLCELASKEFILTMESDCFPTKEGYLDYYEKLINDGCDSAASFLQLSGGYYAHPAGALFKRSIWLEAWRYCQTIQYTYFPSMAMKENFACHLMVHESVLEEFLNNPEDYIILSDSYKPYTRKKAIDQAAYYSPIAKGPMHNGMGRLQESVKTYGNRDVDTDVPNIMLDNKAKIIYRVGYEPGEFMCFWQLANNKMVYQIPTEIKWLKGREYQQQEYTLNEAGVKHIWCGSSYLSMENTEMHDVYEFKKNQIEELYNYLPEHLKIKF